MKSTITKAVSIAALLAAAACNKDAPSAGSAPAGETASASGAAPTITAAESPSGGEIGAKQAREMFNTRCATCHGPDGRGNGPGAITLTPKPRNYHDQAWQSKVTDEEIKKTITYGGAAVGKSPMMPASPDLDAKPQVVEGLVKIIREFGRTT